MSNVKKNKKKGFTLVELMIVVVIMVILAAAASPIFKGYVDRAKEAGYLANCRTIYVAAQTTIQDWEVAGLDFKDADTTVDAPYNSSTERYTEFNNDVQSLAQLPIEKGESYAITIEDSECTKIVYTTEDGKKTVTFEPKKATLSVVEPSTAAKQ